MPLISSSVLPLTSFPVAFCTSSSLSHEFSMSFSLRFLIFLLYFLSLFTPLPHFNILEFIRLPEIILLVEKLLFLCNLNFLRVPCLYSWGMPCWSDISKSNRLWCLMDAQKILLANCYSLFTFFAVIIPIFFHCSDLETHRNLFLPSRISNAA